MSKHTPTPWTMTTVPTSVGICHKIGPFPSKRGGQSHACIYSDYPSHGNEVENELLANAAHIVHCVNHHDELVAALGLMCDAYNDAVSPSAAYANARAILAKVKDGGQRS